jgi:hypothetical protein
MIFCLPGFDQWTFQVVMLGSMLVLEAVRDDLTLSTVLEPMDSTQVRAHQLISRPCCALVEAC